MLIRSRKILYILITGLVVASFIFIFQEILLNTGNSLYKLQYFNPTNSDDIRNVMQTFELDRENATFFTLCRNSDVTHMVTAAESIEEKFNSKYKYDWVFLNDEEFTPYFMNSMRNVISGNVSFGVINSSMWGYPPWINQTKAAQSRQWLKEHDVVYGDLESYHHMCRFQSGFFFRHELMEKYKYSWRVEPGIDILCKLKSDPFRLMRTNELVYGFNVAPHEIWNSIRSLWPTTKKFLAKNKNLVHKDSLKQFVSNDDLAYYNLCHFWSNFEIIDMDWLRSKTYLDYFNFLDREGGFYYERWGDAPVRSIAASLFLPKHKIHFFNEIGYFHSPFGHCPYNQGPLELECDCHPQETEYSDRFYDYHKYSCLRTYFQAKGRSFNDINSKLQYP